jgi:hypothetical protein
VEETGEAIEVLAGRGLSSWTTDEVLRLWPEALKVGRRDDDDRIEALMRDGLVVNEHCYCCDNLGFRASGHLRSITLRHMTSSHEEAARAAETWLEAAGTPSDARVYGPADWSFDPDGSVSKGYRWEQGPDLQGVDIKVWNVGDIWRLSFNWFERPTP